MAPTTPESTRCRRRRSRARRRSRRRPPGCRARERFRAALEAIAGVVHEASSIDQAAFIVAGLAERLGTRAILSWTDEAMALPGMTAALQARGLSVVDPEVPQNGDARAPAARRARRAPARPDRRRRRARRDRLDRARQRGGPVADGVAAGAGPRRRAARRPPRRLDVRRCWPRAAIWSRRAATWSPSPARAAPPTSSTRSAAACTAPAKSTSSSSTPECHYAPSPPDVCPRVCCRLGHGRAPRFGRNRPRRSTRPRSIAG